MDRACGTLASLCFLEEETEAVWPGVPWGRWAVEVGEAAGPGNSSMAFRILVVATTLQSSVGMGRRQPWAPVTDTVNCLSAKP